MYKQKQKASDLKTLNNILEYHLNNNNYNARMGQNQNELEVRFGTRNIKKITKISFDNVIKKIKSLGYQSSNELGNHILKIQTEFEDPKTGEIKLSSIRSEIHGISNIQDYCRTNSIQKIIENNPHKTVATFVSKIFARDDKDLTISPRVFTNNNLFLQTEYRQAFENSNLITDLSFNKKNETNSHFFTSLIG